MHIVLRRAWQDTYSALGGRPLIVALFLIAPVGLGLRALQAPESVRSEWESYVLLSLGATAFVALALYSWFLALAPYRIQRDRAVEAERTVQEMQRDVTSPRALHDALSRNQATLEEAGRRLENAALIVQHFERLQANAVSHSKTHELAAIESDLRKISTALVEQLKGLLPSPPPRPSGDLVIQSDWNQYKCFFEVPMRMPPRISFPNLPREIEANIMNIDTIGFEARFYHIPSRNAEVVPFQIYTADARLI